MILYSVLSLFGLGLVAAAILAVASRIFYVEEDPRVEAVVDALPGANCGGCGYAGCEGYAVAVVNDPKIAANLCCAGSSQTCIVIGELTGKSVSAATPLIAFRRCEKISGNVVQRYEYQGMPSCSAATLLVNGTDACHYSCLGYGDCIRACAFDAMYIEDRMVRISADKCTGCGSCISACPRSSLSLIPAKARVAVHCATRDKLKAVMDICKVGCINCSKCIKVCPAHAISEINDRIEINHRLCIGYGPDCAEICVDSCPRKILRLECNVNLAMRSDIQKVAEASEEKIPKNTSADSEEKASVQV